MYFLNGRVWWNDPDPCTVRAAGKGIGTKGVTLDQARLTASWVAMAGQFFLISDWLPALPPERLDILKRTMLSHNATARPVDYLSRGKQRRTVCEQTRTGVRAKANTACPAGLEEAGA